MLSVGVGKLLCVCVYARWKQKGQTPTAGMGVTIGFNNILVTGARS